MHSRLTHRIVWGLLDQVASSLSNVIPMVIAARVLSADGLGTFALCVALVILCLGLVRAMVSEPFLVSPDWEDLAPALPRAAAYAGACLSLVLIVAASIAWSVNSSIHACLFTAAICAPGAAAFDALRMVAIKASSPKTAFLIDTAWVVFTCGALFAADTMSREMPEYLLIAWLAPPTAIAFVVLLASRRTSPFASAISTLHRLKRQGTRYCIDYFMGFGSQQIGGILLVAVLSIADLGDYRLSLTWYGPIGILFAGVSPLLVADLSTRTEHHSGHRLLVISSICLAVASVAYCLASLNFPILTLSILGDSAGPRLTPLLLPVGTAFALNAFAVGATIGLRSQARTSDLLRVRFYTAPLSVALPPLGAHYAGIAGAGWGLAIAAALSSALYWHRFRRPPIKPLPRPTTAS